MSVNVEQPPPPLFSQQAPSPSFSSPPQSPTHLQHTQTQTPVSSPPPPQQQQQPPQSADVDMSTSTATLPPIGQRHDREDTEMQDGEGLTNGHAETQLNNSTPAPEPAASNVAVEVAAVDEDAMDTTSDENQQLVLPNGSVDPQEAQAIAQSSPAANGVAQEESGNSDEAPPAAPTGDVIPSENTAPPVEPPPPADPNALPPPPPVDPVRTDTDSSDDDDGGQPWHPIQEDTSSPDEAELKEIEATTEYSALNHEHWESKAFLPLDEPEYTPGESGRIEWTIDAYNGTREKPNREIVMKSQVVTIGGYDWQIKFYPKGNDSDYLSVYVECLSVEDKETKAEESSDGEKSDKDGKAKEEKDSKEGDQMETTDDPHPKSTTEETPREPRHAPLPLLDSKTVPKRKSVAAQVSVVLYNPTEPRVNYSRTCLHRFCAGSPDWGWTRFHGPYYDIAHRLRGQRQALLRDDKLAFTGYIRIISDETDNLWEHHSRENPWDSFAMTGLQSLMLGEETSAPGGNLISTVAAWMLFKPFRNFLYTFKVPDPEKEPFVRPKPLVGALQKVLYMLRTQVEPGAGSVTLDDVLDALEWYGIHERLDKLDVMEIWEVLRVKIEVELQDTPFSNVAEDLFGPKRDYTLGTPSYRAPVLGVSTMQEAINKATNLTGQSLPQLLTIELERQEFDTKTRSYVKVMNKVSLDDNITVNGTLYTLYGFVVHKQTLQSYIYQPVLRPEGPKSKWYSYSDSKDDNMVRCLTKRQALEEHEGKPSTERVTGNDPIAYIVMYVRNDVAESAFTCDAETERWEVPEWIREEIKREQASNLPPPMPPMPPVPIEESANNSAETNDKETKPAESPAEPALEPEPPVTREFHVFDSKTFIQHEGPGLIDVYDSKWQPGNSELVRSVQLAATDGCKEVREKVAALIPDIKDPRQVKFWFLNSIRGAFGRPHLIGTGKIDFSSGVYDRYTDEKAWSLQDYADSWDSVRLWIHVIDFADLPPPPPPPPVLEEPPKVEQAQEVSQPPVPVPEVPSNNADTSTETPAPPPPPVEAAPTEAPSTEAPPAEIPSSTEATEVPPVGTETQQSEDTPMSEPDEPDVPLSEPAPVDIEPPAASQPPPVEGNVEAGDTAMVEVGSVPAPDPPAVDVVIPNSAPTGETAPADTEMGGTQEDLLPPPPPPPADFTAEPPQPPQTEDHPPAPPRAPTPPPPPDEIYFFLKIFNPETQTLEARGSHIVLKSARVDNTVSSLLSLPSDQKFELCEEEELMTTRPLKLRRSFAQVDLHNTSIVIVTPIQTPEQRTALAARAAFADPQSFLNFRASLRNFADKLNGHFTHSSFSSQFYKGEYKNGHRHGHGFQIYHSGATYEGTFCLGQRHGHGLYTFQNGDTYDGDWVANQQHGSGTFVEAATGNTYVGGWKNDKKFGEGVTHWKNAQEAERLCRICWEDAADTAFYDCGHVVACLQCAREVQTCPVCRKRVLSAMKLYYVA